MHSIIFPSTPIRRSREFYYALSSYAPNDSFMATKTCDYRKDLPSSLRGRLVLNVKGRIQDDPRQFSQPVNVSECKVRGAFSFIFIHSSKRKPAGETHTHPYLSSALPYFLSGLLWPLFPPSFVGDLHLSVIFIRSFDLHSERRSLTVPVGLNVVYVCVCSAGISCTHITNGTICIIIP